MFSPLVKSTLLWILCSLWDLVCSMLSSQSTEFPKVTPSIHKRPGCVYWPVSVVVRLPMCMIQEDVGSLEDYIDFV